MKIHCVVATFRLQLTRPFHFDESADISFRRPAAATLPNAMSSSVLYGKWEIEMAARKMKKPTVW
jgi:hypothetical protein